MRQIKWYSLIVLGFVAFPLNLPAQDSIQVVPIGESIKPEAPAPKKRRRRRYRPPTLKEGTTFMVELGTALSSGITETGQSIAIYAAEDVGPSRRPGILKGAVGRAKVTLVDEKAKTISVKFESIEAIDGTPLPISGSIQLSGEGKKDATANVGEKFTATLNEKYKVPRSPKDDEEADEVLIGFMELSGKGVKVNLEKGKAKGRIEIILEAPRGYTADDIDTGSVRLSRVAGRDLANPVIPNDKDPKQGDNNKNGTNDWEMYFDAWEFVKDQPEGIHNITVTGKLKNGTPFQASTRVQIKY